MSILSIAVVAPENKLPLFSRTVFTGGSNHVSAEIVFLLLFREFQLKP